MTEDRWYREGDTVHIGVARQILPGIVTHIGRVLDTVTAEGHIFYRHPHEIYAPEPS